jgi:hypothetical protein
MAIVHLLSDAAACSVGKKESHAEMLLHCQLCL